MSIAPNMLLFGAMFVSQGYVPEGVHAITNTAHPEDSVALAEHLAPEPIAERLKFFEGRELTPNARLERAWLRIEHALSTPGTEDDATLFAQANEDIDAVLQNRQLRPRSKASVNATLLKSYQPIFWPRSQREPVSNRAQKQLQQNIGNALLDFMNEAHGDISPTEYGTLSELIFPYGALYRRLLPYLTSGREEANKLANDNHDYYTLHPCDTNIVKKVPVSVKHASDHNPSIRPELSQNMVVTIKVGKLAMRAARRIPEYAERARGASYSWATRTAADIMVCHALGEKLDESDTSFLRMLTHDMTNPIHVFANSKQTPDYLHNARTLEAL